MDSTHRKFLSDNLKRSAVIFILILLLITTTACNKENKTTKTVVDNNAKPSISDTTAAPTTTPSDATTKDAISAEVFSWIDENGTTLASRFNTPEGFNRIDLGAEDLTGFLRGLPLKKAGSEVLLYDGSVKANQTSHIAVFDLDIGDRDLQQCADSVIRIYAEYYWSIGAYDKIAFHLTNGFLMEYTKWRDGYRLAVNGNDVSWTKSDECDSTYEEFRNYLTMVFAYAGTLSLYEESSAITVDEILPGDLFLEGGSPGHCVMVVDVAEDTNGNRCFLLAQGFMPAQDFHIIKNPMHPEDPWYYSSEISYPFQTPLYTFDINSLVRWNGLYN